MSNAWFQFKKFKVAQDNCAMKVTTDACIQGAWTPTSINNCNILDIGTGTGLLSLMLAQRNEHALIDAVEIDTNAAEQAKVNFNQSTFSNRISVHNCNILEFKSDKVYDLIICNPPFFTNNLLGPNIAKNNARHTISFSLQQLLNFSYEYLSEDGMFSLLLPTKEFEKLNTSIINSGFSIYQKLQIQHKQNTEYKRTICILTKKRGHLVNNESLTILQTDNTPTLEFKNLMSDFYLNY